MIQRYLRFLAVMAGMSIQYASAQGLSTQGKDFWIAFLQGAHESTVTMHVYVSSSAATSGTVSIPLNGWSQSFTVAANSTTDIVVPTSLCESNINQVAENKAVHVVADTTVSVYALDYESYSADASVILPTPSLGYDYWVMTNKGLNSSGYPSDFSVLSIKDGSQIEITPSFDTQGGSPAGVPFTITLDSGQTYLVNSNSNYNADMTGSHVRAVDSNACHKFALFAGTRCSDIPDGFCCCDMLYEQMLPTKSWGFNYYSVPLKSRNADYIRLLASEDNTIVNINGGGPIPLSAGQHYDYVESAATIFSSNLPLSVAQFSPSLDYDGTNGDPFYIMISPIEQNLNQITFNAFSSNVITNYYLNVVTKTSATAIIALDGVAIGANNFQPYANDPLQSYAQLDISQGNHTLQSDSGFIAYVYGFGGYESFGYGAGANLNILPLSFSIIYQGDTIPYLEWNDTIGCPGTFTVIAQGDTSYTGFAWDFGDGTSATGTTVTHTYTSNGAYTITLSGFAANQCAPDEVGVTIVQGDVFNLTPSFNITYQGNTTLYSNFFDTLLCDYTVNFSALLDSAVQDYVWDFGTGDSATGANVTYTFDTAGVFTVTLYEQGDSCHKGIASWTIVVEGGNNLNPLFYVVYNGDTTLYSAFNTLIGCHRDFEFIGYYDSTLLTWNWNFGDGTTGSGQTVTHHYSDPGTYTVSMSTTAENSCFDTTISMNLTIVDSITVSLPDTAICYGQTIVLQAATTGNPSLVWSTGSTGNSIIITQDGTYSVTGTLDACTVSDTTEVAAIPLIQNFMPPLDSICVEASEVILLNAPPFQSYQWSTGDSTQSISVNDTGYYSITVTDLHHCKGSDTIAVIPYCNPVVVFPTAFSPNGDSFNDGFGAVGLHVTSITFTVYNRWGTVVYTGHSINDRWDGKYKGVDQPVGVYVFTAEFVLDDHPEITHHAAGNVTLVR